MAYAICHEYSEFEILLKYVESPRFLVVVEMEQIQNAIKDTSKRSIRRIKFDIIIGMLSDDDKLFAQVKDFFQKVEMIKKYCKKL